MNRTSAELKLMAKRSLKGHYGSAVGATALLGLLLFAVAVCLELFLIMAFVVPGDSADYGHVFDYQRVVVRVLLISLPFSLVMMVTAYLLMPGLARMLMNFCTGRPGSFGDIGFAFRGHVLRFLHLSIRLWLLFLAANLPYVLASLLVRPFALGAVFIRFMAWAVSAGLSLLILLRVCLVRYILTEDPDKTVGECFQESDELMRGHKGRYFWLLLCLFPWMLLGYCSFGIGYLWAFPFMECVKIHFYLDLKEKNGFSRSRRTEECADRYYV